MPFKHLRYLSYVSDVNYPKCAHVYFVLVGYDDTAQKSYLVPTINTNCYAKNIHFQLNVFITFYSSVLFLSKSYYNVINVETLGKKRSNNSLNCELFTKYRDQMSTVQEEVF